MRAIVLDAERRVVLAERPEPEPGAGEVLVRPEFIGICGTDLHAAEISAFRPPVVMGHEFAGSVVATGEGVTGWQPGDRVTVNPNANVCGTCEECRQGRYNLCRSAIFDHPVGVACDGGMADAVVLKEVYLRRLPDSLDTQRAAWTEPLAVAVRAVRGARFRLGAASAVIGAGPIGLLVTQVLRRAGASSIVAIEPSEFRRAKALQVGASTAFASREEALERCGVDLPRPRYVFECSGHRMALETALKLVAPGGHVRMIGVSAQPVPITSLDAISKEVTISGNFIYTDEFEMAIELLAAGDVDVDSLTSAVLPLDAYADAFAALRHPESAIKVLLQTS